jgi:hypothetical protein
MVATLGSLAQLFMGALIINPNGVEIFAYAPVDSIKAYTMPMVHADGRGVLTKVSKNSDDHANFQ